MQVAGESITLDPVPGYVIKTRLLKSNSVQVGTKVFLNVCHDKQVPKPEQDFDPSVVFPLIVDNKWEIPIIVSREKSVTDKKGQESLCYDCCINDMCMRWCTINRDLKSILNEWCIEAVELLYGCILDRDVTFPKMLCKGELSATVIQKNELTEDGLSKRLSELKKDDSLALLEEMKDSPMEDADGDEDPAIDIFNRPTTVAKRPLIEELDAPVVTSKEPKPPAAMTEIKYAVSFQKAHGPYTMVLKFESNLPYEFLKLEHDQAQVIVSSKSPSFVFDTATQRSEVKIPLPHTPKAFKSFHVDQQTLIFC